jgi:hypothetical protein
LPTCFLQRVGNIHDATSGGSAHRPEAYSPKCSMALAGTPRSYENELPRRLFSHPCLEAKFSELRGIRSGRRYGGEGSRSYDPRSVRRGLRDQTSMCVEALCRVPIGSAGLRPSRSCSMATKAFKPALKDSETCGSGLVEESGTLRRYRQGRAEDLHPYKDVGGSPARCRVRIYLPDDDLDAPRLSARSYLTTPEARSPTPRRRSLRGNWSQRATHASSVDRALVQGEHQRWRGDV